MFEANPLVSRYCERPAFAEIAGVERLIDFWVERVGQQHWFVIDCAGEAALDLEGESASAPSVSTQAVELFSPESFKEHHIWTQNWLSILPYLAANARLVDPALVDKVSNECREATALWAIEQRYAREDRMLVRTAVFIALHRGQLVGVDLREHAWGLQSRFVKTPRPYAA
jgi:hypothetical protein